MGDLLARLGGDEFALLLDTRDDAGRADAIADRIVEALAEPYWVDGESLMLGCSLGLARASAGTSADALLWHAQLAMRQAKASRGCTGACTTSTSAAVPAAWPTGGRAAPRAAPW